MLTKDEESKLHTWFNPKTYFEALKKLDKDHYLIGFGMVILVGLYLINAFFVNSSEFNLNMITNWMIIIIIGIIIISLVLVKHRRI